MIFYQTKKTLTKKNVSNNNYLTIIHKNKSEHIK